MGEKYKIYKSVCEELPYIKKKYEYCRKQLSWEELNQLDVYKKIGYELSIYDKFLKYELIRDFETDEILEVGDEFFINEEIYSVRRKVFNVDFNCYNLYTDKYELIELEENVKEIFLQKYEKLKELNDISEECTQKKEKEILSNTIVGRWSNFKDTIRKMFN